MHRLTIPGALIAAAAAMPGCRAAAQSPVAGAGSRAAEHYLDQFIDTTVDPRADFFHYAVGKWLAAHPIPASERWWGISRVVQEETYQRLLGISRDAGAATAAHGSSTQKIGDFYAAAVDTARTARLGFSPLASEFARIDAIQDRRGVADVIARMQYIGVGAAYALSVSQDEKKSDRYLVHLWQGGLGLPERDYYFDTDARSSMLRREYVKHVAAMLRLLGDDSVRAASESQAVMEMETELADASRKLADLRDPVANYHSLALSDLDSLAPGIDWAGHLRAGGITGVDSVILGQPEFFRTLDTLVRERSLADWKAYLRWQLANAYAGYAGGAYDREHFHFFGTILSGTPEQRPPWKRALDAEDRFLGDALGQLYVQRYFSPRTKARYEKLTEDIFAAFRDRIRSLSWMSEPTRQRALRKLDAVTKKVGYPEHWRDYATYDVDSQSLLGNALRGNIWASEFFLKKLHEPVDRREWLYMTPQTYNAYYNAANNEIVLPAAIFILPGIPDSLIDDALVYSYTGGTTIGHEITHGFDDQGRKFDELGNLVSWWSAADEHEFNARAAGIVHQFDAYLVVDSMHVSGRATEGENIADLGGINLAWDAFTKTRQYKEGTRIGGLTPAQRFFIGWSLGWMNQVRPETMVLLGRSDVHAPDALRTNGPVSNMAPFYEAYGVRPADAMYRPDSARVKIW